jgi:hypothetical protein
MNYDALYGKLKPLALKLARGHAEFDHDDLLQDALLAIVEAAPSTEGLAMIVGRRRMMVVVRSAGAKKRIPDLFELPVSFDPYPEMFARLANEELRSMLSGLDAKVAAAIANPAAELIEIVKQDLIRSGKTKIRIRPKHLAIYLGTTEPKVRRSLKRLQALGEAA